MRSADFFIEVEASGRPFPVYSRRLNEDLLESLRAGPLLNATDASAAEGLLDLVQDELTAYATRDTTELNDVQLTLTIRTLEAVSGRLGLPLRLPFRDFSTFRRYLLRHKDDSSGLRATVDELLDPLRRNIANFEAYAGPRLTEQAVASLRDPWAIREHLVRVQRYAHNDPPLAIGIAKELIESTAKTVLLEKDETVDDRENLPALVDRAQRALGLHPSSTQPGPDGTAALKRILGGLVNITGGLAELRNSGYGTGHGPTGERIGLRPRHADLAVNAAMTWCSIMLDTLAESAAPWKLESYS